VTKELGVLMCVVLAAVAPFAEEAAANGPDLKYDLENLHPGERALVVLPVEFEVLPENRLYLNGERIYHVQMTTALGDTLYLNGVPIEPVRERKFSRAEAEAPTDSDEECVRLYGDVPYVQALVDSGMTPSQATAKFFGEQSRMWGELNEAYEEALSAGADIAAAGRAAFARLRALDRESLVDWGRRPEVAQNCIGLFWKGMRGGEDRNLGETPALAKPRMPSETDKRYRATMIYEALAVRQPCWCLIGAGGFAIYNGEEDISRMRSELDAVLRDKEPRHVYLLGEAFAREILESEGR
jgi:hypothetical protein